MWLPKQLGIWKLFPLKGERDGQPANSLHEENADNGVQHDVDQVIGHGLQLADQVVEAKRQHTQGAIGLVALLLQTHKTANHF